MVRFETGSGVPIFLLPVETFPGHLNNIFLILQDGAETLFDVGSGLPQSKTQLSQRFEELQDRFGVTIKLRDLSCAVVSHAHIDHFGGVHDVQRQGVPIWIHELDARVLSNFEERITIASKDINVFLRRAGVHAERRGELTGMYTSSKQFFKSVQVDRRLRNGDRLPGDMEVIHAPGHCPGLICLKIDDVLLTSDQVLSRVTPNQMPQSITPFTGLENYLRSLDKVAQVPGVELALGAHEAPIQNLRTRVAETALHHQQRLEKCLDLAGEGPRTIQQFADALFGDQKGYGRMLAYTEAGAHIEYLHQMGRLHIANLDEVMTEEHPVIQYGC